MATYSTVNDGYDVTIHKSAKAAFRWVDGDDYRIEIRTEEGYEKVPLTKTAFMKELRERGEVRIYDEERFGGDWIYKVQKQERYY